MKFSIITVTYNAIDVLESTINSVVAQTYDDYEYIVIDGLSTDGTVDIIRRYENKLSYWISEKDGGIYDAMNKGIAHARGDVISFLNAGDMYEKNALEDVNKAFGEYDNQIIYGKVVLSSDMHNYVGLANEGDPEELHIKNIYCHQGLFIKRELFSKVGLYDLRYSILADYDWNLRAHNMGYEFKIIPKVVARYQGGGISDIPGLCDDEYYQIIRNRINNNNKYLHEIELKYRNYCERKGIVLLKKRRFIFDKYIPHERSIYIWGAGSNGKICKDLYETCNYEIDGYIDSNFKNDTYLGLPVYEASAFIKDILSINCTIIITPKYYDEEIKEKLINHGVNDEHIIMFCDLLEDASEYYLNDKLSN